MSKTLEYTNDLLTQNFLTLDRFANETRQSLVGLVNNEGEIIEAVQSLVDYCQRLEGRVSALENIRLVVRAPRGSKLFLLSACGLAGFVGYKYALSKVVDMMDKEEQHLKSRVDHPAGRKVDYTTGRKINDDKTETTTPENN